MNDKVYLTRQKYKELLELLERMKTVDRKQISKEIGIAREKGDLRENAEYDAAKEKQAHIEKRIAELEAQLSRAQMVEDLNIDINVINISATVVIEDLNDNMQITYSLVGPEEADFDEGKISVTSPVGSALLGHKAGDTVEIDVPVGKLTYKIVSFSY